MVCRPRVAIARLLVRPRSAARAGARTATSDCFTDKADSGQTCDAPLLEKMGGAGLRIYQLRRGIAVAFLDVDSRSPYITKSNQLMASAEIDERDFLSREEFTEDYLLPRKPVVLRSAMCSMPAVERWDLDFFASRYGSHKVPVDGARSGKRMLLEDYIKELRTSASAEGALYMRNLLLFEQFPELRDDFEMPWIAQPNWLQSGLLGDFTGGSWKYWVELFLSGPGSRFPFVHIDPYYTHAWSIQLSGRKRFWLWAPIEGQYERLLAGTQERQDAGTIGPDTRFESYFPKRKSYSVLLEPGDMAFLPAGWWHTTETSEESVTLGGNFVEGSNWREFREYYVTRNPHHTIRQAIERRISALVAPLLLRARRSPVR